MPAEVINRVHILARRDKAGAGVSFTDRAGNAFAADNNSDTSDDDDSSYDPNDDSDESDNDSDADDSSDGDPDDDDNQHIDIAGVHHPAANIAGVDHENNDNDNGENDDNNANAEVADDVEVAKDADQEHGEAEAGNQEAEGTEAANQDETNTDTPQLIEQEMEEKYGQRTGQYALQPRRPRDYNHLHATLASTVMTQHSMKKGIKLFGEAGVEAVLQELKQLQDRKVLEPRSATNLSQSEKKAALQYLMFLKQKRSGKIKGRGCADGRKQREHTNKEDASSPTVAIESVLLSCTIDAKEGRDVATVNIPGAFMRADMDQVVHLKMQGQMAELLVKLNPKLYRKHVQTEGGKTVLHVELRKALYGTLRAALLFWRKLTEKLKEWGFEINPYDWCVANKTVNGKQCTILWHVDDLKISHVDPQVVTDVISQLDGKFGKEAPLTITRGKIHDYIGMSIEYDNANSVQITMIDYIKSMLGELPPDMDGESATPAASHLFDVSETPVMLTEEKGQLFYHNVAKLLFLCKRARPDIQTAVAFLCTRVKASMKMTTRSLLE